MGAKRHLRSGLGALALVAFAFACEGEAERTFYNDFDAADATAFPDSTQGSGDAAEDGASAIDGTIDSGVPPNNDSGADDGGTPPDARTAADAGGDAGDGAVDAAPDVEAGCGPVDTVNNCGQCGRTCDQAHSQGAACTGTGCTYSGCVSGYGDCDASAPNTSGCETPITSVANCTGCGIACDTTHSHGAGCGAAGCTYGGCNSGYADCDAGAPNANGCETPTTTTANCGGCGAACKTLNNTGATCSGTACSYTCSAGYSNCNTTAPNTGGCECHTPTCCMDAGAGVCQTTHATGFPNLSYYDCNPPATAAEGQQKLLTQAIEACTAYTGDVSQCATGLTCNGGVGPYVCNGMGGPSCSTCWSYGGSDVLKTENCACPPDITVIGSWN
jgi:hypothetical protein